MSVVPEPCWAVLLGRRLRRARTPLEERPPGVDGIAVRPQPDVVQTAPKNGWSRPGAGSAMANDAKMRERKVPAPAAAGDRVAARFAMLRDPHPAVELTAAPHLRVDGGHARELVPVREGLREQCHPLPRRTTTGRAVDAYPMARLDPVGANVDRGPGGEGGGREREHEGGGETEREPARRRVEHGPPGSPRRLLEAHRTQWYAQRARWSNPWVVWQPACAPAAPVPIVPTDAGPKRRVASRTSMSSTSPIASPKTSAARHAGASTNGWVKPAGRRGVAHASALREGVAQSHREIVAAQVLTGPQDARVRPSTRGPAPGRSELRLDF